MRKNSVTEIFKNKAQNLWNQEQFLTTEGYVFSSHLLRAKEMISPTNFPTIFGPKEYTSVISVLFTVQQPGMRNRLGPKLPSVLAVCP